MAQHDMNIANQGFPAFRGDLNDALAALVSNSSGATQPATTFAHQWWVDTASNPSVLKIRNADNDAFITIGTIDQTDDKFNLTVAGTLSAQGNVSFDGGSLVFNESGGDRDARFEGDTDANLLFTDASTDRVGVGKNNPAEKLDVAGTIQASGTVKVAGTSSAGGDIKLFEDTDNGTNFVALKAAASITADVTFTLPAADGTADQVLKTDGSGNLAFATAGGAAGGMGGQVFTSSGTFTIPSGVEKLKVTVIGGGGNGGGTTGTNSAAGGGGGGLAIKYLTGLTGGNTLNVTVGTAANTSSVASGTETISTVSATGGASVAGNNTVTGAAGGAGSGGDINQSGGGGGIGAAGASNGGGGGGGSGGATGFRAVNAVSQGGASGFLGGCGGNGSNDQANGRAATGFGNGGAGSSSTVTRTGGAGSAGVVVFEF